MSENLSESKQVISSAFFDSQENNIFNNGSTFARISQDLLQGRQSLGDKDSFKLALDYMNLYFTPVIIFTGLAGNFTSIIVLLKTFLKVKPWSLFLAFRAFVDTGYLLCLFLIWLPRINILVFHSPGVCQTIRYFNYIFYFLSSWSVVGLTIERYLTLYYPMVTEKYCTRRGTIIFILIKIILGLVLYNFATWTNQVLEVGETPICMPVLEYYHLLTALNITDKVIVFIIPVVLIVCLNACIIVKIWLYSKLFKDCSKQVGNSTSAIARLRNSSSIFQASLSQSGGIRFTFYKSSKSTNRCNCNECVSEQIDQSGRKQRDGLQRYTIRRNISRFQSSKLLISLSFLFIVTATPTQIFQFKALLTTFSSESFRESETYLNIQELCHLVSFLNFSMVFVVLIFSSDSFRTALFRLMIRCKNGKKKIKVLDDSGWWTINYASVNNLYVTKVWVHKGIINHLFWKCSLSEDNNSAVNATVLLFTIKIGWWIDVAVCFLIEREGNEKVPFELFPKITSQKPNVINLVTFAVIKHNNIC